MANYINNQDWFDYLMNAQDTSIGYPCNMAYDYSCLNSTMQFRFNNVGSPFQESTYKIATKQQERRVLEFFQKLWGFKEDSVWGYVTGNGSTEGNLQALYIARQAFPNSILYTSQDTHYSIPKIAKMLQIPLVFVKSQPNGEMDYNDFEQQLLHNIEKSVIINANLGTTMKGAIDNTREIYRILCTYNKQNDYYMHGDGALMGFVLPFIEHDVFFKKCLHSISVSGHKFLGVPFPCGVFMMEKRFVDTISNHVEYINNTDCTISGSRNGHNALFMDYIISSKGYDGFKKDIVECIDNSEYLLTKLNRHNMKAWRNQNSITVVFDRPSDAIVRKWQLACSNNIAHSVVLPHVTRGKIRRFMKDIYSTRLVR